MDDVIDIGKDGKAVGPLQGAPTPDQLFAVGGHPITSAVAYSIDQLEQQYRRGIERRVRDWSRQ